ncbi:MAG TPA: hypothetical protein VKZ63_12435, partial [Kofleriaceae bacterium]|nr:hypothetical protein [Kofleriaceae bacterium]
LPIDLLPLREEIRRLLEAAGVRTLGEFAALPPPSVGRPAGGVDYRELARGKGPAGLGTARRDGAAPPALPTRRAAPRRSPAGGPSGRQLVLAS